ncbi:glycerate kinase [Candidatus Poribacteria bacterium]|nr:glycerate kinase [Candidatus Poribacteria bacterium]
MKIVIAPDSFKGSLSAQDAAEAIAQGFRRVFPDAHCETIPMADGGEGTAQSLVDATGGRRVHVEVRGPTGRRVVAHFGLLGDGETAAIEMAAASGLPLIPFGERNPLKATTYGTGELIRAALDEGARKLIIGIGGSATNDGGAGMAQALGAKLLDADGNELELGGGPLGALDRIDLSGMDARLSDVETVVACDVDNPLTGPRGASAIYGPQKGATPEMVQTLDASLVHYAKVLHRDLGKDVERIPGAGAAGGLGAGLMAFLNAQLRRGVEIVLDAVRFDERLDGAAFVVTGEGELNRQTAFGKTPMGVAQAAKRRGLPVFALAGTIAPDADVIYNVGIDAVIPIVPGPFTLESAIRDARSLLTNASERLARLIRAASGVRL